MTDGPTIGHLQKAQQLFEQLERAAPPDLHNVEAWMKMQSLRTLFMIASSIAKELLERSHAQAR